MATKHTFETEYKRYQVLMRTFLDLLSRSSTQSVGYTIEEIEEADEVAAQENGVEYLNVTELDTSEPAIHKQLIKRLGQLKKDKPTYSTRFVSRFPGLIVVERHHETLLKMVKEINECKQLMANQVRFVEDAPTGIAEVDAQLNIVERDKYQRHQFIHSVAPGIMTEQLYRNIHVVESHVTNCWFNWTQRNVPKNYFNRTETIKLAQVDEERGRKKRIITDDVRTYLTYLEQRPQDGFTETTWSEKIDAIRSRFSEFHYLQRQRVLRNMPICTYQYRDRDFEQANDGKKPRNTKNVTTPILLFGQPDYQLPTVSKLPDWDLSERASKKRAERSNANYKKERLLENPALFGVFDKKNEKKLSTLDIDN